MNLYFPTAAAPDRYAVGNYIVPINTVLGSGNVLLADTISFLPFVVERSIQINELGARVAATVASSNFQLAIYDTSNGLPTVPIVSTGNLSGAVSTNITGSVATTTLTAGRIYAAAVNGTAGIALTAPVLGSSYGSSIIGTESLSLIIPTNTIGAWNRQLTQTYGTWPTVTGLTTGPFQVTRCPAPILRVSALL